MDSRGAGVSGVAGGVDRRARAGTPDGTLRQRQPPVAASKSATASASRQEAGAPPQLHGHRARRSQAPIRQARAASLPPSG